MKNLLFGGVLVVLGFLPVLESMVAATLDLERRSTKIKIGMTEAELIGVLGVPPRDYTTSFFFVQHQEPVSSDVYSAEGLQFSRSVRYKGWLTSTHSLVVTFLDGKVLDRKLQRITVKYWEPRFPWSDLKDWKVGICR